MTRTAAPTSLAPFPAAEVERRLREELTDAAEESAVLRGFWEPVLDSLRMVGVLCKLEDLFEFKLPPEKLVRKGGYYDVDEGVTDMKGRLNRLWEKHQPVEALR